MLTFLSCEELKCLININLIIFLAVTLSIGGQS